MTSLGVGCGALSETRSAPMRVMHNVGRLVIYRTGALSRCHRLRNRQALTAVTFHRVLRRDDPRWETALPPWTLTEDTFGECLRFFKRHYNVVTLDDLRTSIEGTRALPSRSLLIKFDDTNEQSGTLSRPLSVASGWPDEVTSD